MAQYGILNRKRRPDLTGRIILDADEWALRLVCRVLEMQAQEFGQCRALAVAHQSTLVAGVVYHDYRPQHGDCQMTIASTSPRWAGRETIAYLLQYPFIELDCRRVSSTVRSDNLRALQMNVRLGFCVEGVRREFFAPGVDCIEFGMMREEWAAGPYRWTYG
jgi:RimJ/RimL family protein N-acetyltransferase